MGSDAAAARQLQVELALATRKLDACSNYIGVCPWSGGICNRGVVVGAEDVQTIQSTVHHLRHLWKSATAHPKRTFSTDLGTPTTVAGGAVLTATMLRHVAILFLLGDVLSAAQAGRSQGYLIRALGQRVERVRPGTTEVRLLDVFGVRVVDHIDRRGMCG